MNGCISCLWREKESADLRAEKDALLLRLNEARLALEIAKPSTIHVLSGHVYGPDDKLVEFVDGCARCRIEKLLEGK